jgi:PAS domain S-box-containing protein
MKQPFEPFNTSSGLLENLNIHQLLDTSIDVICVTDREGRFLYVNEAARMQWGYAPDELVGQPFPKYIFSGDPVGAAHPHAGKTSVYFENRFLHKSGHIVHLSWSSTYDPATGLAYYTSRDVSAKKKEAEAQEAERRKMEREWKLMADILDSVGEGFLALDREWRVTFWNERARQITGLSREEVMGRCFWEIYPSGKETVAYEAYHRAVEEDKPVHFDFYFPLLDSTFSVNVYPTPDGVSVTFINITEHLRQKQALRVINERYEFVMQATSDILWDWDLSNNELFLSNSFSRILGYELPEDKYSIELWSEKIHPDDLPRVSERLRSILRDPEAGYREEIYRFVRTDGQVLILKDRAVIIRNSEGRAIRMTGSAQDITRERLAEVEVERRERRFRAMVQAGQDVIVLLDDQFRVQYVSANAEEICGFAEKDLKGVLGFDRIHPQDLGMLFREGKKIVSCRRLTLPPFRFKVKSGAYHWAEATINNHLGNADIRGFVVNLRDITKRKTAEDERRRLSMVAEKSVNAIVITDVHERIIWVNEAFEKMCGYTLDEVRNRRPGQILQGAGTAPETKDYIRECMRSRLPFSCEILNYRKGGKGYWAVLQGQPIFDEQGNVEQFFAIITDITAGKATELFLRESEERYRLLFHGSPVPKWIFCLDTLTVSEVNQAALDHYGYTREEAVGMNFLQLHPAGERSRAGGMARKLKDKANARYSGSMRHLKADGSVISVDVTAHSIPVENTLHAVVMAYDITERTRLEMMVVEEKINSQKEITRAMISTQEKERSIIGKELHDNVNQILTTAKLYVENLHYFADQKDHFIAQSQMLIQRAINEIRALSKALVTPTIHDIGFEATVQELVQHYRELNLFELEYRFHADETMLEKDMKLCIYRIIQELMNNIVKYAKASAVTVAIEERDAFLEVLVSDNGVGFNADAASGGLGLNNIRNRTEMYRGSIRVEAEPGRGCRALVRFPL